MTANSFSIRTRPYTVKDQSPADPNLLKAQILYLEGRGVKNQLPTFDTETKSDKIPNSLFNMGGAGGLVTNFFQHLMLTPNLLKSQIPYKEGEWGDGGGTF